MESMLLCASEGHELEHSQGPKAHPRALPFSQDGEPDPIARFAISPMAIASGQMGQMHYGVQKLLSMFGGY